MRNTRTKRDGRNQDRQLYEGKPQREREIEERDDTYAQNIQYSKHRNDLTEDLKTKTSPRATVINQRMADKITVRNRLGEDEKDVQWKIKYEEFTKDDDT